MAPPASVAPAMRRLLYVAALLVFLAGVQLFVFPLRTARYFAWTIDSPMTAVFLGASYWSAVGLEVGAARAARWSGARIAVPAVFVFTTVTLVVTLVHLESFHLDGDLPLTTRAVTWAWLAIYAVVPVLMVAATVSQRREFDRAARRPGVAAAAGHHRGRLRRTPDRRPRPPRRGARLGQRPRRRVPGCPRRPDCRQRLVTAPVATTATPARGRHNHCSIPPPGYAWLPCDRHPRSP